MRGLPTGITSCTNPYQTLNAHSQPIEITQTKRVSHCGTPLADLHQKSAKHPPQGRINRAGDLVDIVLRRDQRRA